VEVVGHIRDRCGLEMVEDVVRFVTIAEIAGVFVGFAALVGVTRRAEPDVSQLSSHSMQMQWLMCLRLLI